MTMMVTIAQLVAAWQRGGVPTVPDRTLSLLSSRARSPIASEVELLRNGAAAFAASACATCVLHPIDTLKTRLQSDAYAVSKGTTVPYSLRRLRPAPGEPRQRLFSGLYSGLSANVLKEAPDAAVFLALSEELSRSLSVYSPWFASHFTITLLLSGAIGDACGSILRLPAEVLCKRLQTGVSSSGAPGWQGALEETTFDSWMSTWGAIVARDVPMGGLQIAAYQEVRTAVQHAGSASESAVFLALADASEMVPDSMSDMLAGVLAGAIAAALTTPLDVLVTHASTMPSTKGDAVCERRGTLQIAQDLVREQGPLTLLRGLGYRTLYCACAATSTRYLAPCCPKHAPQVGAHRLLLCPVCACGMQTRLWSDASSDCARACCTCAPPHPDLMLKRVSTHIR